MSDTIAGSAYRVVLDEAESADAFSMHLDALEPGAIHPESVHAGPVDANHGTGTHDCAHSAAGVRPRAPDSRELRDGASPNDVRAAHVMHAALRACVVLDAHAVYDEAMVGPDARAHHRGVRLSCGAVHEIRGLCLDAVTDAVTDAGSTAAGSVHPWIVPFGCIVHILRCMASDHPSNAGCRALLDAGVVWIGDRVHPSLEGLACALQCGTPVFAGGAGGDRFTFVRDAVAGEDTRSPDPVPNRVWCAEQAIRMGAAGVVIVDGTGFDTLAWRRLQLAASGGSPASHSMADDALRPLVLVMTPPEGTCGGHADRGRSRGGGGASTRWSVHPTGLVPADGRSGLRDSAGGDFGWRMQLDAVKRVDAGVGAWHRAAGGFSHGDMESGCIFVDIVMPRAMHGGAAWSVVERRARARAHAASGFPIDGLRELLDVQRGGGVPRHWQARSA